MINLEQIRLLETKVQKAVERITQLSEENTTLRKKLGSDETRIQELENLITQFKSDQLRIEEGILNALSQLDMLEDTIDHRLGEKEEERSSFHAEAEVIPQDDEVLEEDTEPPVPYVPEGTPAYAVLPSDDDLIEDDVIEDEEFQLDEDDRTTEDIRASADMESSSDTDGPRETELDIF